MFFFCFLDQMDMPYFTFSTINLIRRLSHNCMYDLNFDNTIFFYYHNVKLYP